MPAAKSKRPKNRKLKRGAAADYVLEVTTRSTSARRRRKRQIAGWILRLFLLAALAVGVFYGARTAFNRFFFANPDYTLQKLDLHLDNILTREEFLEETGVREGMNLFSVDLAELERTLRAIPMTAEVRIQRIVAERRLAVTLRARAPVAWVAPEGETGDPSAQPGAFLVDAKGVLMKPRHLQPEYLYLPAIYGAKSDNIRQGEPLHCEDLRLALELLAENAARPDSLLHIRSMDISRGYRIDVLNDQNARISFAASDFGDQLDRLQRLLLHCAETGRALETVNLMVKRNTPVTFVMAAAQEPKNAPAGRATKPGKSSERH